MDTIKLTLDGREVELVPSLRAAEAISSATGGFMLAFQKLAEFDFNTFVKIIAAGIDNQQYQQVAASVYATGLQQLADPIARYLTLLVNGGKTPGEKSEAA